MTLNRRGFTLVELLVVVAMIAVIMGAISTSFSAARTRAQIQKATSEVKVISQAILACEAFNDELKPMEDVEASGDNLPFLLGRGTASGDEGAGSGGELPVLLMAKLQSGGVMLDPWGKPYRVTVREQTMNVEFGTVNSKLKTGYYLPNLYRTTEAEK